MSLKAISKVQIRPGTLLPVLLALVLAGLATMLFLIRDSHAPAAPASARTASDLLYVEFGATVDTLWRSSAENAESRERLLSIEHGIGFGIVPSLAPDRSRFVYTSLAANLKAVAPDVPAQVWLATLEAGAKPRQVADNADLLVNPVWSPDGASIVFRRSTPESYHLIVAGISSGGERDLVTSTDALFPIAFAPDGRWLYVARIRLDASELLRVDASSGKIADIGLLASGLTRDWALSPDGSQIAYLEMTYAGSDIVSHAFLIDTVGGARRAASDSRGGSDFSPVWADANSLTIGQTQSTHTADGVTSLAGARPSGFDVPLGWSPDGDAIAVRSFDGQSAVSPGNVSLGVIHSDGSRTTLTNKEATFLGWTNP